MVRKKSPKRSPKKPKAVPIISLSPVSRVIYAQAQAFEVISLQDFYQSSLYHFSYINRGLVLGIVQETADSFEGKVKTEEEATALARLFQLANGLKRLELRFPVGPCRLIAENIRFLYQLEELNLTGRSLYTEEIYMLSESLRGLSSLKALYLRNCGIKTDRLKSLGATISSLTSLTTLDLSWNELEERAYETLCEMVSPLHQLRHLNLSKNYLSSLSLSYLAPVIGDACTLEVLDFSHNNAIKQSGGKSLMRMFGSPKVAKRLLLDSTPLDESSFQHIGSVLPKMERLEVLSLSNTACDNVAIVYLTNHIEHLTRLKVLRLKSNKIGTPGMKKLSKKLPSFLQLEELHLRDNVFSTEAGGHLAAGISPLSKLQRLRLGLNIINETSGIAIFEALRGCPDLTHLEVTLGSLHKDCAGALANCVSMKLQSLSLRESRLEPDGALYLSEALVRFQGLRRLNLSRCLIREEGSRYLAGAIVTLQQLSSLKLWYNFIHNEGFGYLLMAFKLMPGLNYVDVSDNIIDDPGAEALARTLPFLLNLKTIDLRYNSFSLANITACIQAIKLSCRKCELRVEENSADQEALLRLRKKCAQCGHKCFGVAEACAWERRKVLLSAYFLLRKYRWC
jgi:Ran GTPase-activating protein (RanGAP) involved in mRNA processing and transport